MVEFRQNAGGLGMANKKRKLPAELAHRFKSKDDFLGYFQN